MAVQKLLRLAVEFRSIIPTTIVRLLDTASLGELVIFEREASARRITLGRNGHTGSHN